MNNYDRYRENRVQNGYYGSNDSRSGGFGRGEQNWRRSPQDEWQGRGNRDWDYGGPRGGQGYGGESRWDRDDDVSFGDYDYGGDRNRNYAPSSGGYGQRYGMSDMGFGRRDWGRGRQDFGFGRREGGYERPSGYGYERSRDFGRELGGDDRRYERMSGRGMNEGRSAWDQARERMSEGWERMKESFSGRGPKGYTRSDDRIKEDVCDLLSRHHEIDASDIEVSVKDGEVMLDGQVRDRWTKRMAEDVIDDVHGVKEVLNRLRVSRSTNIGSGTNIGSSVPSNGRTMEGSSRNAGR